MKRQTRSSRVAIVLTALKVVAALVLLPLAAHAAWVMVVFNPLVGILVLAVPLVSISTLWWLQHPVGVVLMLALVAVLCMGLAPTWSTDMSCGPGTCN